MNQSTQRALFLRNRENIEQGAYVGGVTVSKPGIERDWWRLCFLEELALFLRAQVMLIKQACSEEVKQTGSSSRLFRPKGTRMTHL